MAGGRNRIIDTTENSNAELHVSRIPNVSIDHAGLIRTNFGTYHPVTGERLPIEASDELMGDILIAFLRNGKESRFAEDFDINTILAEIRSKGSKSI